jgi:FkbM family methyltransferase
MTKEELQRALDAVALLVSGGRWNRFLHRPWRYLAAISFWRLIYPLTRRGKIERARTFFGTDMQVLLPAATEIFLFGAKTHDSEIRLARFLIHHLKPGHIFCDVGAHFGYFTLLASRLIGSGGRVYAFEAASSVYELLAGNTAQSGNAKAFHRAASASNEVMTFHEFPVLYSEYNSLKLPDARQARWLKNNPPRHVEVAGQRLDDFFMQEQCVPNVVKIDVEGAEPQVLTGMERLLTKHAPLLVMEYLIGEGQQDSHREAVALAVGQGYHTYRINAQGIPVVCPDVEAAMRREGLDSDNIVLIKAVD